MDKKNVRVFFEKKDRAIYISHLDLMRTMQRALKRSKLPIWHTEGFNPRIYLNFPLALSLGVESTAESMDIAVTEEIPFETIVEKLNEKMPLGLRALKAAYPVYHNKEIGSAKYMITFSGIGHELKDALDLFMAQKEINVEKHSKRKGLVTIDIKPHICVLSADAEDDGMTIEIKLPAGLELNINAAVFTDAFMDFCGKREIAASLKCAKRTNIYCINGAEFA